MLKLLICFSFFSLQDSTTTDTLRSVIFLRTQSIPQIEKVKYLHQQGFFCNFEDQINKGRRLNLNIGVGEQ